MADSGGADQKMHKPSDEAMAALARLSQVIADPKQRPNFAQDPHGTVPGYHHLPPSVREAIESLSDAELDVVARTLRTLGDEGFYVDTDGGRLEFF